MPFWTPETIRAACAGSWIIRPPQIELPKDRPADLPPPPLHAPISGLSTDTRTLKPSQAFLALRGESFDGHRFLAQAVTAGAPILIIDDADAVPEGGFTPAVGVMKVADTGQALLRIAAAYRKTLERTRVVAVCGSNGKTTTAGLIGHLLSTCGLRGTASKKSFNNAVGVPLTILSAQPSDQYLICEVGTNAPGEIAQLAEVVNPDIAVITSIGREHLEKLGDLAGVAREEASVLKFLRPKGCAVVNADIPELAEHLEKTPQIISFGRSDKANFRLTSVKHVLTSPSQREGAGVRAAEPGIDLDPISLCLSLTFNNRFTATVPLLGEHNALNALAALAVARRFGVDEAKALGALSTASGPEMRLQVSCLISPSQREGAGGRASLSTPTPDSITIINDAYNANPDSMSAAVRTLAAIAADLNPARTVVVLADMLELGAAAREGHESVARVILDELHAPSQREGAGGGGRAGERLSSATTPADRDTPDLLIILAGPNMAHAHRVLAEGGIPDSILVRLPEPDDAAIGRVAAAIYPGDLVLLKGSRRTRLERVLEALRERTFSRAVTASLTESKPAAALAG